jgi:hypothetical protein
MKNLNLRQFITIITSEESLKQFKNDKEDVKIWLHNNVEIPELIHQCLYDMIPRLKELYGEKIKIGFAVGSILNDPKFCIDVKGKTAPYEEPKEFEYILEIISAVLGVGNKNKLLFHSIHAKMINIELPFKTVEEFYRINDFIEKMIPFKDVIITKDPLTTCNLLRKKDDKYRFFITINAEQTFSRAMAKLSKYVNSSVFKNVDWIVGSLEIDLVETALLFIIINSRIKAICLDELDMKILSETFNDSQVNYSVLLSPEQMKNSFYPERAVSAEKIMKLIEGGEHTILNINKYGLESFNSTQSGIQIIKIQNGKIFA